MCVCVFVCVFTLEAINNWWRDMDPIRLVKQVLQLYMATVVIIVNERGLGIGMRLTR